MTTRSIGAAGYYSTLILWFDECPSDLVTDTDTWEGEVLAEQLTSTANILTISGITTNATYFITLRAAADAALMDDYRVLNYNTSYASINSSVSYSNVVVSNVAYTRFERLQFQKTASNSVLLKIDTAGPQYVDRCFFKGPGRQNYFLLSEASDIIAHFSNSAFFSTYSGPPNIVRVDSDDSSALNCTIMISSNASVGSGGSGLHISNRPDVRNCAIFNAGVNPITKLGGAASSASYCATDATTIDATSSVTSLTHADQWTDVDNTGGIDIRLKSGHSLQAGVDASADNGGVDIFGTTYSTGSPIIGCEQDAVAGGLSIPVAMDQYARLRQ